VVDITEREVATALDEVELVAVVAVAVYEREMEHHLHPDEPEREQ
jgi:hypothetical protein